MRSQFISGALVATLGALCATASFAQAPGTGGPGMPGAAPAAGSSAVANPNYVTLYLEIEIDRPAAEVWKRVGKYCDIGEWMQFPCTITSGKDGEIGTVRSIANEILVGKTELSYTYTQPVAAGRPYNLFHGTMEARPVTATTSKIVYTVMWDNSMLADDAARERDMAQRRSMFENALKNMKTLSEGGTIPPRAGGFGGGRPGGPGAGAPRGGMGGGMGGPGAPRGGQPQ